MHVAAVEPELARGQDEVVAGVAEVAVAVFRLGWWRPSSRQPACHAPALVSSVMLSNARPMSESSTRPFCSRAGPLHLDGVGMVEPFGGVAGVPAPAGLTDRRSRRRIDEPQGPRRG